MDCLDENRQRTNSSWQITFSTNLLSLNFLGCRLGNWIKTRKLQERLMSLKNTAHGGWECMCANIIKFMNILMLNGAIKQRNFHNQIISDDWLGRQTRLFFFLFYWVSTFSFALISMSLSSQSKDIFTRVVQFDNMSWALFLCWCWVLLKSIEFNGKLSSLQWFLLYSTSI